ncbi:MAG: GGDEF domain-containing protein [Deltaproteobacteria bacterium]|nr:GGDEF domain-containing protein [Deltaproteobacteria bacterium]
MAMPHVAYVKQSIPQSFPYLPYAIYLTGIIVSLRFNLTRIAFVMAVFIAAYWCYDSFLSHGVKTFQARTLLISISLLLPLNMALFSLARERGVMTLHGGLRGMFIIIQFLLVIWVIVAGRKDVYQFLSKDYLSLALLDKIPLYQSLVLVIVISLLIAAIAYYLNRSPLESAFMGAILSSALAALFSHHPNAYVLFISVAGLILIAGVMQNTHFMAYRDELTGLLARRALNERTLMLGREYTVAMLDVDHFKKFNDTYGHDVGDQVLKMVASILQKVGGGGKSYRYGGEEFTILFPGKGVDEAMPHLEALRENIAAYRMKIRGKDRPQKTEIGKQKRGVKGSAAYVSVTISIGAAQKGKAMKKPEEVVKSADQALYRAKKGGRNRVSR